MGLVMQRPRERRRNTSGESVPVPTSCPVQSPAKGRKEVVIYYTALFLRVALWLTLAWALSYLHMGAPCFLLAVLLWVYSVPLKALFSRAKRHGNSNHNQDKAY